MHTQPDPSAAIATARLDLVPLTAPVLEACLVGDRARAEALLGARLPDDWQDELPVLRFFLGRIAADAATLPWLARAIVLREGGLAIGHCGFHGPPGMAHLAVFAPGGVEMGYTVFAAFRRRGYASEAVGGLMGWAAAQGVPAFALSIAPGNAPSQALARRLGFARVGSHEDPEDGLEEIFVRPVV